MFCPNNTRPQDGGLNFFSKCGHVAKYSISFYNQSWSMISGAEEPVLCKRCGKEADLKADELT